MRYHSYYYYYYYHHFESAFEMEILNKHSYAPNSECELRMVPMQTETVYEIRMERSIPTSLAIPGNGNSKCVFFLSFVGCELISCNWNGEIIKIYNNNILFAFGDGSIPQCLSMEKFFRERDLQSEMNARSSRARSKPQWPFFSAATTDLNGNERKKWKILIPTSTL